jgi:hypothetical protein
MADYVECPFCDYIFEEDSYHGLVHQQPLDDHIRVTHAMVKVRKGSNYRWLPRDQVRSRITAMA